ncbi:MAG TPA: ribbon-helix-helix domain-containing protein [Anaerolineales bacterium]|nr:ribbon-helix-helix domain-containing protein [Anaerolineales bacterium]
MANKILISVPEKFLEEVDRLAAEEHRSRSELIREVLRAYMETRKGKRVGEQSARYRVKKSKSKKSFPNIEIVQGTGGPSAVIRGTRIHVFILIGYLMIGERLRRLLRKSFLTLLCHRYLKPCSTILSIGRKLIKQEKKIRKKQGAVRYWKNLVRKNIRKLQVYELDADTSEIIALE